jgi:hypothetical protein
MWSFHKWKKSEEAKLYSSDSKKFVPQKGSKMSARILVGDAANLYVSRNIMINLYGCNGKGFDIDRI